MRSQLRCSCWTFWAHHYILLWLLLNEMMPSHPTEIPSHPLLALPSWGPVGTKTESLADGAFSASECGKSWVIARSACAKGLRRDAEKEQGAVCREDGACRLTPVEPPSSARANAAGPPLLRSKQRLGCACGGRIRAGCVFRPLRICLRGGRSRRGGKRVKAALEASGGNNPPSLVCLPPSLPLSLPDCLPPCYYV